MTGSTIVINQFDQFFVEKYQYLLGFTKSIDVHNDYENLLHDCYLKCKTYIMLSGYSGATFINFVRVTIMNAYKNLYRDKKEFVEFCEPNGNVNSLGNEENGGEWKQFITDDWSNIIEAKLQQQQDFEEQEKQHDSDMVFYNTMAFEYVNQYYNEKENMIFKTYYVLKHKHLNYKQLSEATNYSMTSVSKIIKRIKKDLRENLMCYINTGMRVMELKQLIEKVELILNTDANKNKQNYRETYLQVFGKPWNGCSCNPNPMREALKIWYNNNKAILNQTK